jgi:hypothetical protein
VRFAAIIAGLSRAAESGCRPNRSAAGCFSRRRLTEPTLQAATPPLLDAMTQLKLSISYAHADGESTVKDFWTILREFLKTSERQCDKWD